MNNIINFETSKELKNFLDSKRLSYIAEGSEGKCFASKVDNDAYKVFFDDEMLLENDYDPKEIITADMIELDCFAFPKEIYTLNGKLKAYRTKKIDNDLFKYDEQPSAYLEEQSNLYLIDFKKLEKAYLKLEKDIINLSKAGIKIYDLCFNLTFDGESLIAIDTCGYTKVEYDVLEENISSLNYAIENLFSLWLTYEDICFNGTYDDACQYIRSVGKEVKKANPKIYSKKRSRSFIN
jgi:hypothetical protein